MGARVRGGGTGWCATLVERSPIFGRASHARWQKPVPGGWNRVAVIVSDLESMAQMLRQAGVVFRSEIITGPGGKQALVEDGCGNVVELFEARE